MTAEPATLDESTVGHDPIAFFDRWWTDGRATTLPEPNAATLATCTPEGRPSARIVLLKGVDARGFVVFTNYESRKGREIHRNGFAALVFYWPTLVRQVRVEGSIARIDAVESDEYFRTRPRDSQIGAWASPQSEVVESRTDLEQRFEAVRNRYEGRDVPRPPHWGGLCLAPERIEFWQGRASRLHDRIEFTHDGRGAWARRRLAP